MSCGVVYLHSAAVQDINNAKVAKNLMLNDRMISMVDNGAVNFGVDLDSVSFQESLL